MNINDIVDYFLREKFLIIPVKPGSKEPAIRWRKVKRASKDDILRWVAKGFNLAVVCGSPSDNLVTIDCDKQEIYDKLFDASIERETLVIKTGLRPDGTRGYHVYFKTSTPIKTKHYAQRGLKLDIQSESAIVILPPSKHPSGVDYEFATTPPPPIKRWVGDFEYEFTELIKNKLGVNVQHQLIDVKKLLKGVRHGYRDVASIQIATFFRKQGLTPEETFEKLKEWDKLNLDEDGVNPDPLGNEVLWIKVKSAYTPEEPYQYRFKQEPKHIIEEKISAGENLDKIIFEQVSSGKFLVFDKEKGEVLGEQDTVRQGNVTYVPLSEPIWKTAERSDSYRSLEALWNEIRKFIYDHLDMPHQRDYDLLTAWVLANWTPELWPYVPYLFLYGPHKSGKTRAQEVLTAISFRPVLTSSLSVASIYYMCTNFHPTLMCDETGGYLTDKNKDMIGILNSGYRRGQKAIRLSEPDRKTGERKPVFYDVFGFKVLSGTEDLQKALKSRNLVFQMRTATRRMPMDIDQKRAQELRNQLLMYRFRMLVEHREPFKGVEATWDGRLNELFTPLIHVAPESYKPRLLAIARGMYKDQKEVEYASPEADVLRAFIEVHKETMSEKITTRDVANRLNMGVGFSEQVSEINVGRILSKLGLRPTRTRNLRAYRWSEKLVEELKQRYMPEEASDIAKERSDGTPDQRLGDYNEFFK